MKNPINILVVEDRANHIADCRVMFEEVLPKLPIQVNVLWAKDLMEAISLLPQADAVMTDVFFPASLGTSDEEPNGQKLVERCLTESKPVVWVTSTYHHGKKTEPISRWGRKRGLEMFDCQSADEGEASNKPWKEAFYGLLYCVVALDIKYARFEDGAYLGEHQAMAVQYIFEEGKPIKDPAIAQMAKMGFPRS